MLIKGTKEIQFEAYNFIAKSELLEKWFLEVGLELFSRLILESKERGMRRRWRYWIMRRRGSGETLSLGSM